MLLALIFSLLISNSFAIQNTNEVCSLLSICDNIAVIRAQVADVREEQERQANILEGTLTFKSSPNHASDLKALTSKNNNELCTIPSICDQLSALSSELAAVRAEQERQADLLEKSCQTDKDPYPANCYEALNESQESEVTVIRVPEYSKKPFEVACDQKIHDGGWTIILRRTDGSEDFFREWKDYKEGFGQVNGEYFVGLDKLHFLSSSERQELLVVVEDEDEDRYEMYDNFRVGGEANNYTLESLGSSSGTAGDALAYHLGMQFSTKDRDNDLNYANCAEYFTGAWWYRSCYDSNLAAVYSNSPYEGYLNWNEQYVYNYTKSLKTAIMMIRPRYNAFKSANVE